MYKYELKNVALPSLSDLIRTCPMEVVEPFINLYNELGNKEYSGDVVSVLISEPCDKEDLYERCDL